MGVLENSSGSEGKRCVCVCVSAAGKRCCCSADTGHGVGPEEAGRASHKNAVTAEEILLQQEGGDTKRFRLTHGCKQDPGVSALLSFLYSERCKRRCACTEEESTPSCSSL